MLSLAFCLPAYAEDDVIEPFKRHDDPSFLIIEPANPAEAENNVQPEGSPASDILILPTSACTHPSRLYHSAYTETRRTYHTFYAGGNALGCYFDGNWEVSDFTCLVCGARIKEERYLGDLGNHSMAWSPYHP
jgi:hypothetical protein